MTEGDLHLFLHVPKTAGTTVLLVAHRHYGRAAVFDVFDVPGHRPEDALAAVREPGSLVRCVSGHFSYGLHLGVPGRACRYVTMLRDPLRAVLSLYHYACRNRFHPCYAEMCQGKVDFAEWLRLTGLGHADNYQLRIIVGKRAEAELGHADLEYAKELLATKFAAVGVTDRFDETILLFAEVFGWDAPYYVWANVGWRPSDEADITDETRALVAERHALDAELVTFARELLAKQVAARGQEFQDRLLAFQAENRRRMKLAEDGVAADDRAQPH